MSDGDQGSPLAGERIFNPGDTVRWEQDAESLTEKYEMTRGKLLAAGGG